MSVGESIYRFCPLCGHALEMGERFGKHRPVCPVCGWAYFVDPKVAAAAVVLEKGCVLLTRRVNEPQRGLWSLPAGFVDAFEDPARAAERECWEETGLRVEVSGLMQVFSGREHPHGADIVLVYCARWVGGNLVAGDDADQVAFFARDQLPPLAFHVTQQVLAQMNW